jgi:hypothetical protein
MHLEIILLRAYALLAATLPNEFRTLGEERIGNLQREASDYLVANDMRLKGFQKVSPVVKFGSAAEDYQNYPRDSRGFYRHGRAWAFGDSPLDAGNRRGGGRAPLGKFGADCPGGVKGNARLPTQEETMKKYSWLVGLQDYEPFIGPETVERITRKAQRLRGLRMVNISSTFYGGGVAELLSSGTLLAHSLGVRRLAPDSGQP